MYIFGTFGLPHRGNDAELLKHAHIVDLAPVLHNLAVLHAANVHLAPGSLLPGCWDAHKFASLRSLGSQTHGNLIAIGKHVFNRVMEVGKFLQGDYALRRAY